MGPERTARMIAGHLLSLGFSAPYLHRWWTYRIRHETGERPISDIVAEAGDRAVAPLATFDVLIPLKYATSRAADIPEWRSAAQCATEITAIGHHQAGLAGGLRFTLHALDDGSAVEDVARAFDRYAAMLGLGGGRERILPFGHAYVVTDRDVRRLPLRRPRGLELPVLLRRDEPLRAAISDRVDAGLELLAPVDTGPAAAAVAGAWAAVETLLTAPGDRGRVAAADRLAALITTSFVRAELTQLAHTILAEADARQPELLADLGAATTNTERGAILANRINDVQAITDPSAGAALARLRAILERRASGLKDVEAHLTRAIRRLYRVRNLVLHGGETRAAGLDAALRSAVPLVGAGLDRIARGALLRNTDPIALAVTARIRIDNADVIDDGAYADLLDLAD